jgi:undecaprenyl-diphosphatase
MTFLQALVLGIVQGLTEFIPVSSSGHLVIVPWLFGWAEPGLAFSAIIHWGTILAVLIFFWKDLYQITAAGIRALLTRSLSDSESRIALWIVIGTIPAVILGVAFHDFFEHLFNSPIVAAGFLLATSLILSIGEWLGKQLREADDLNVLDALAIGLAQAIAILPGISRSGITISTGLLLGVRRAPAARFSFLLMVPATLSAGLLSIFDLLREGMLWSEMPALACGFVAAAISGFFAIRWLLSYLSRRPLWVFSIYCAAFGLFSILLSVFRG